MCQPAPGTSHLSSTPLRIIPISLHLQGGVCHVWQLFPVTGSSHGGSGACHAKQHVRPCPCPFRALPAALENRQILLTPSFLSNTFPSAKGECAEMLHPRAQVRAQRMCLGSLSPEDRCSPQNSRVFPAYLPFPSPAMHRQPKTLFSPHSPADNFPPSPNQLQCLSFPTLGGSGSSFSICRGW